MLQNKRIAIFTERLKSGFGVDLVVNEQAKRLAAQGYQVCVFAINIDDVFLHYSKKYSFFQLPIKLSFNPLRGDYHALLYLKKIFHLITLFDVVILHSPPFFSWTPFLGNKNVIVYDHGNSPSYHYKFPVSFRQPIFEFSQKFYYFRFAKKIATISLFLKGRFDEELKKKTSVIYHGNEHILNLKIERSDIMKFLKKNFINKHDLILTYVGRLDYRKNPYKNTNVLVKLFLKLKKRYLNIRLFMIGFPEGDIVNELRKSGVDVRPNLSSKELKILLSLSKIYLSPSLWEGFNLPLVESQSLGIPVVAFDVGAHREVVKNEYSGFLVKNEAEFYIRVKSLLDDQTLWQRMAEEASIWGKYFTWERNITNLIKLINS